ncbi:MAG TPA: helical backbone metal receptor [Longimicrobiales bacterium]|nr:helical backbone metal receptor [Longimicrobiales bacterium]
MRAAFVAAAFCVLIAGCERKTQEQPINTSIAVTDDAGQTVRLAQPATRVVSLLPTVTDLIIAMHQEHRLIARTDYDKDPAVAALPSIGGGLTPSVEWLADKKPDLVISWPDRGSRSLVTQMQGIGIPVFGVASDTIANTYAATERLGILLGAKPAADSLVNSIRSQLDSVHNGVGNQRRVRVAYVVSVTPTTVVGPHTFIDELITIAGGENIFADFEKQYAEASLEELIRRDPDVIIIAREEAFDARQELSRTPGWRDLRAVRNGHVYRVDANAFNRSGPGMPNAARTLAQYFAAAR